MSILERSRSIGTNHTYGNLNQVRSKMPRCALLTTQRPRGLFVKTVFSAFGRFDSAPAKRMRGPCHLFVKRMLQTREEKKALIQSLCFFLDRTRPARPRSDRVVYPQLGIEEAGPLEVSHFPSAE
jgi:hypothetical protein